MPPHSLVPGWVPQRFQHHVKRPRWTCAALAGLHCTTTSRTYCIPRKTYYVMICAYAFMILLLLPGPTSVFSKQAHTGTAIKMLYCISAAYAPASLSACRSPHGSRSPQALLVCACRPEGWCRKEGRNRSKPRGGLDATTSLQRQLDGGFERDVAGLARHCASGMPRDAPPALLLEWSSKLK